MLTMHDMDDEARKQVLGEVLMDELKTIREYVEDVPGIKRKLDEVDERLISVESDVTVIKAAVRDISGRLQSVEEVVKDHDRDIRSLKQKVA